MKNTRQPILNESDKPQWWLRFAGRLHRPVMPRLKVPRFAGPGFPDSELVIRHLSPSFGKALNPGPK